MLTAKTVGLSSKPEEVLRGTQLAIYDSSSNLIAIIVEVAPGITQTYFIGDDPEAFKRVANSLGIPDVPRVTITKV